MVDVRTIIVLCFRADLRHDFVRTCTSVGTPSPPVGCGLPSRLAPGSEVTHTPPCAGVGIPLAILYRKYTAVQGRVARASAPAGLVAPLELEAVDLRAADGLVAAEHRTLRHA